MENDKDNVAIGLPKPGGAIYWAPAGTTLPTDASTALDPEKFVNLGYVTEDGLTLSVAEEGSDLKAWGPETIGRSQESYAETFTFALLESVRPSVAQFVYGVDNVTLAEDGTVQKINHTGKALPRGVFVCDTLENNGNKPRIHRQVAGDAQLVDRSGDKVYNNADMINIPTTLSTYKYKQTGLTAEDGDYVTDLYAPATTTTP